MPEPTDRERINNLEAAGSVQDERLGALEAAGLALDQRTIELAKEVDGLQGKIEFRAVIEQAKGVIMRSIGCGADAAFAVLVAQSQSQNRKVHDIAVEIAAAQDRLSN